MSNVAIILTTKLRKTLAGAGAVACLVPALLGTHALADSQPVTMESRFAAEEMRLIGRQVAASAWQSAQGRESTFQDLARRVAYFDEQKGLVNSDQLAQELSVVDVAWQPIKRAAQILVDAGPEIVFTHDVVKKYGSQMDSMQDEFAEVADIVREQKYGSVTNSMAQKNLWLNERINRNINSVLAGSGASDNLTRELKADSAELLANLEALTRGDESREIRKITDPAAVEAMSSAFRKFSTVSTALDRIVRDSAELSEAAAARETILSMTDAFDESLDALVARVNGLAVAGTAPRPVPVAYYAVPAIIAIALLLLQFLGQRRRARSIGKGVAEINTALQKIAGGDLTVSVSEDNKALAGIARQINAATGQQKQLIQNIRGPFDLSIDEIKRIGLSARALVEKGKELTRSVGESITVATEMVRTSEEIKTSTAEAARTSDRNCQQVAQGYELTKDMSKASVDVRESVQETSKSAKRQGELIQSVTAAAEYIQALNTKISVVAINTRIEAEKAGEYGRPFLGIAEAIADLLREAGEEGRKIISEVRMLQNMSAENLASMENTVGTVVTILEYIDRLDGSLEEINSGSAAISSIIRSVDDAAGKSAVSALHMNSSMTQIRERNLEIAKVSESTRVGVSRLQRAMQDASESLGQFRADSGNRVSDTQSIRVDELEPIGVASTVYREEDMSALESAEPSRASV
ncbi:MAG: methyl-accepting chemotaxis protein [Halieaceae bacterium]|jgi:twitching motility protein PilJ|nr:methyl-accepting chemotaxis protein [Halieaceae bacterium]